MKGDSRWSTYGGLMVAINRADATEDEIGPDGEPTGRKLIRLRVAAFKDGMRPDGVRTYVYVFANEVKVPEGHDHEYNGLPQVGVDDGRLYTLEPASEGVAINDDGDAVATEPGTYQARAKVNEGYRWEITDPVTGETRYTTDDQTVAFTITKKEEPTKQHTITFDLNGGTMDGQTGTVTRAYDEGTVIKLPEPAREGYSFDYWEGSRYSAGDEYEVTEDHTFTAQWKEKGSDSGDKDDENSNGERGSNKGSNSEQKGSIASSVAKTGDDINIPLTIVLMIGSLLVFAMAAARRKNTR